jgi:flagellar biosynthesis chaperone FliJ
MKKFEFRLASILRLREAHLTMEKNKLQQLFAERAQLDNNLRSIGEERIESEKWIHAMSNPASGDLRALSAFLLGSKAREATLQQAIQNCDEMIAERRQLAVLAERNVKLLLNLRAKQKTGWQREFDKELESIAEEAWQSAARSKRPS